MIDIWMKEPKNVAEIQVCNDARAIDTSKHKDYLDKYAVVGCYWPPSIVTLEADTLDPLKIVSTGSYTYDTNEYAREARVAAIIASHDKPEWVINIKETGQVWLYDYSNIKNPKITMVEAERFLHDGGWDLSKRYFLTAANARDVISVIDTKEGKLVKNIPSEGNKPHPGRGANVDHKTYGPLWASGHIGSNDIIFIGTDPVKYPANAWKVVKTLKGQGGGSLFIKTHPKSTNLYVDTTLNPEPKISQSIAVFDINNLDAPYKVLPIAEWANLGEGTKKVVQPEYNEAGDEVWFSVWNEMKHRSAIVVVDDKTLTLKKVIDDKRIVTPTGKFNVKNTVEDVY
jgi:nitrite reductase (NO-forming)/hydroxylamine reductase